MSEEDTTVYYGKYPGYVRDSDDPDGRGRLRLYVPDALGQDDDADHWTDWALPCFPWVVSHGAGSFVPTVGSNFAVWVEFRQGDVRFPIWVGVFPWSGISYESLVVESPSIKLGGPSAGQAAVRGSLYRQAEDALLDAIATYTQAVSTFAGTCVTAPIVGPSAALAAATAALNVAISTFKASGSAYLSTVVLLD